MPTLPDDFDAAMLSTEWTLLVGRTDRESIEEELRRECAPGHLLHGVRCHSVAIRRHQKESVFWLPDRKEWAVVHLTWHEETDPYWPTVEIRTSWRAVVDELRERGRP